MPQFRPFVGTRYNLGTIGDLASVVAPPYDVIDSAERHRLEEIHPNNAVRLILPEPTDDLAPADHAAHDLSRWLDERVLTDDDEPAFYLYRMGFTDDLGRMRQTSGVIGALSLSSPGEILPHEETMAKPLGEQLALLRSTQANLSPIYLLTPAPGISLLFDSSGPPDYRCTDPDGTHHRIWRLTSPAVLSAISEAVLSHPLVVADGHHRYETACKYSADDPNPAAKWIMALVVELDEDELYVRPTHRLFLDADPDDVAAVFHKVFPGSEPILADAETVNAALAEGRTVLVGQGSPSPALASSQWTEGSLLGDELLRSLPVSKLHREMIPLLAVEGRVEFEPDTARVLEATATGRATAAVAIPPVTVEAIRRVATAGLKMPQKTTYFSPKPRTGAVFRRFEADSDHG